MNSLGIAAITDGIMKGLDDLFTSDDERNKAKLLLQEQLQKPHMMQAMINIEEAKHRSVFVAGWRPAIGWICAAGLAYSFLMYPFTDLINAFSTTPVTLPALESDHLMTLVLSLLGLGGLRTYEKKQGLSK